MAIISTSLLPLALLSLLSSCTALDGEIEAELERCGEIIDEHFHSAGWFSTAEPLLAEMDRSGISRGVLMAIYDRVRNPFGGDPNEQVSSICEGSSGRISCLASLNTTGDWETERDAELERLSTYLAKPEFVGAKLANPHTWLELDSDIMRDIISTVAASPKPVVTLHIGTTPFCGPFGDVTLGYRARCDPQYVDPSYLDGIIGEYPEVTFVLFHSGHDFLEPDDEMYYNTTLVYESIKLATKYSNTYLEISGFLRKYANGTYARPLAPLAMEKIVNAGLAGRVLYGSDQNHYPGGLLPYLMAAVPAMIDARFTKEERCAALAGNSISVFGLAVDGGNGNGTGGGNGTDGGDMTSSASIVQGKQVFVAVSIVVSIVLSMTLA